MFCQVEPQLEALQSKWDELEATTKSKGERLFDANRHIVIEQGCDDVDSYLAEIESQIIVDDVGTDLTTVNLNLNKQNVSHENIQSSESLGVLRGQTPNLPAALISVFKLLQL